MALLDEPKVSQQQHFLRWEGDIADALLLLALEGSESLSSPFQYQLRSLTRQSESDVARWHGTSVSCRIGDDSHALPHRFLHGVVTRIYYSQRTSQEAECILTLEPSLALLKMGRMMRIWQNISVPELVQTLLRKLGINKLDLQLRNNYPKREYCVQYRESAFSFIHRLLEEEGIYYYFRHSSTDHTLVLADHPASHPSIHGNSLLWHDHGRIMKKGNIDTWSTTSILLPAGVTLQGVNMPQSVAVQDQLNASGPVPHVDGIVFTDITPKGERVQIAREVQNTLASREANARRFDATVNAHWLCSGETFTLTGHPSGEKPYRIQSLTLSATNNFDGDSSHYQCELQAMHNDKPWHPLHSMQAPEIPGVLTAVVVGPESEDIHTDEYGRVKIKFPWDTENPHDDTSSCWVRVAQPWVGRNFGAQFIPRVGSEVLVSFVQGNPDFPLVTGAVYNGQNTPPFTLPGEKTESGFVTRSSSKGSVEEGHRLSFNDKKGEELLTIVAQKDLSLKVKNDASTIIAANRSTELTKGNDRLVLKKGDLHTNLNNGNYVLEVSGGGGTVKTDNALTLESSKSIELKVGSNTLSLSTRGISINGKTVMIEGITSAELKGKTTTVSGTTLTTIDGKLIKIG
ncbi:type VI secretion system Vgr family protein [Enterobacter asburiae]|nr:type VI secretion system tip protein VgrG [Enterobacter asburiae]